MNANDTQALLVNTLSKIAERKKMEEKKEMKKEKEDKPMKGKSDCSYAEKMAETLDYLSTNFDLAFGSPLQKAVKLAGSNDVPNILPNSQSSGPDGKRINETRDSMATGEEPSENKGGAKGMFEGVPNVVANTADKRPGGASVNPADPPLYNKTAFTKVLAKLAGNKTAGDLDIPNQTRTMKDTDSGKGQSGAEPGAGSENRHLIDSTNSAAMDYTKGDAKKDYNKSQMKQVFDEVHPEKDKALDRAFEHGVEGAKLAGITGNMGLGGLAAGYGAGAMKQASDSVCTCEGKGTCDHCKKTMKKAASILRKLAEEMSTNMPAGATPDATGQMSPPPEMAGQMGGQEDQIEKLKKLLLLMQMAKKQEQTQMMGQTATPDMNAPGGAAASDMAAASAGPSQGMA